MNSDRTPVHVVVFTLAGVVAVGIVAMVFLAFSHTAVPDPLDRIVTLALGALAGILAKTSTSETAAPVTVVNEADQPVPVDSTPSVPPPPLPPILGADR